MGRGLGAWAAVVVATLAPMLARGQATELRNPRQALTQYKIDAWQTEQGLPLNTVQSLFQTRDGYLWVGTGGGLARFDGVRFATFESGQTTLAGPRSIFGFFEDRQGNLWIGHGDGAVIHRHGRFENAFGREVTDGRRVWAFAEGPDGSIWVATENGLLNWQDGVKRIYRKADGLPTERLRSLAFDRDGMLWLATSGSGLVSFDGQRFESYNPSNGFPHQAVRSVIADPQGGVWAATAGGGLAHVRGGVVTTYGLADGLPTDQLTALALDKHGSLWIGTWGAGLVRLREGRFSSISTEGGLGGAHIWSLHADTDGSIWVGTWVSGLNRLRNRDFVVLGTPEGLSHDNVRAVLHARDGTTWVSTAGGGVNRIAKDTITTFRVTDGLPSDEASTLLEDRDGAIWIATYTAGVARLRHGRIESFAAGLPSLDVRMLFQDRSGTVWAGTTSGLARFDGTTFVPVKEPGAPPEGASSMLQDRSGTLWFGSAEGLYRYRNGVFDVLTRKDGLLSNWAMSLYEDAAGTLWIGTNGEGINRFRDGRLTGIRPADGLWDGVVQVILEDRLGNLWFTCNRGFVRVARAELDAFAEGRIPRVSSVGYGPGDALRSTTFAGGLHRPGAVDANGHLWLPSFSGLVIVDPTDLPGSGEPPAVHVEEVTVDGVKVPPSEKIVLPPGSAPLTIRYTTTLHNAERARFRYRMDATREWVDAGKNREASFPRLPHGSYVFRVAASADGRTWREATTPLAIEVRPHFHQTPWFAGLVAVVLLGGTGAFLTLRTRNLRLQKAEMERLVAERTTELHRSEVRAHEAREEALRASQAKSTFLAHMSHELRTPLNVILGFLQLMQQEGGRATDEREQLAIMRRSGEHLLRLINDVLSLARIESGGLTLDERSFSLRGVLRDVEDMFSLAARRKGLAMVFDVDATVPTGLVHGDEGKLRQILINLIGNAVKFTEQGQVAMATSWTGGRAVFEVSDTGPGISPAERAGLFQAFSQTESGRRSGEGTGLGLAISLSFVRAMGGEMSALDPRDGHGARFRVELPLSPVQEETDQVLDGVFRLAPGEPARRLLVVDDSADNRLLLRRLLGRMGFEVREAANGADAVDVYEEWKPDLIWMDLRMDVMDGYDATRRIRSHEIGQAHRTPIVALTASALDEERPAVLAAGCDEIILKPFNEVQIWQALARLLGVRFVTEPAPPATRAAAPVDPTSLGHLPEEWRRELHVAVERADVEAAAQVVDRIRERDDVTATALAAMLRDYRFDEVLALTRPVS